jgi:hypothetical protein
VAYSEELTLVFNRRALNAQLALRQIETVLRAHDVLASGFDFRGQSLALGEIHNCLRSTPTSAFDFAGRGFEFHLAFVGNSRLDFLQIKTDSVPPVPWDAWAAQFIGLSGFVMAWVADCEYQHWQNVEDLTEYATAGKPFEQLPKKSNGLPYPLERTVVDTSENPGRRILCNGYIEAVGALMWLGEPFWPRTGADRKQVEDVAWLRVSNPTPAITRVQTAERCFTSATGVLQVKLRSLLFPARAVVS